MLAPELSKEFWRPSASISNLQKRAAIIKKIRAFFDDKGLLEVETPLVCHTSVTDPFIESIKVSIKKHHVEKTFYLQTSPEYAMKRLLAAGAKDIYQICKAFRQEEIGRFHNPEFTILEWYRLDFDHHALMDEMNALLKLVLNTNDAERKSYRELFQTFLDIDPHHINSHALKKLFADKNIVINAPMEDVDTCLQVLMSHCIEPHIGQTTPVFIYDFPASQSALARIQHTDPPVASRFEVYFKGIELANGFHELQDAEEQRHRFIKNNAMRQELNLKQLPLDEYFLQGLEAGLPNCSGVALGIDRLVMLATESTTINEILSFDFDRS